MVDTKGILREITEQKRASIAKKKRAVDLAEFLKHAAQNRSKRRRDFGEALSEASTAIIAEYKRASPSKGIINKDTCVAEQVRSYESGGARALSVLTEEDFFQGSLEDLRTARAATRLPVLRKDFIIDEFQVFESAAFDADAILLIAAILDDRSLAHLHGVANALGMDCLVEVHGEEELCRVSKLGFRIIGINNRDLQTFDTDLQNSHRLATSALPNQLLISESGIVDRSDIRLLEQAGFDAFLIGESLMRSDNPELAIKSLLGEK